MTALITEERRSRFRERIKSEAQAELETLKGRDDAAPYRYFLELATAGFTPDTAEARTGRKALNLLCIQAPLELIHAAGFAPFKIFSGSFTSASITNAAVPALMCPLLKAVDGLLALDPEVSRPWILPTTCDWVVKFPELSGLTNVHWLELPHIKENTESQKRWLEEMYGIKKFIEKLSGKKISRKEIETSINIYNRASL